MNPMNLEQYGTWDAMTSGRWYLPGMPETEPARIEGMQLVKQLNNLGNTDQEAAQEILRQLFPHSAELPTVHAPLHMEFGHNVTFGKNCFINFNATILAQASIEFGDGVQVGPNCSFITVDHPVDDHEMRAGGWERARPIRVGENCWFGTNVTVLPGVTIGRNCVLAANALVLRDVPHNSLVVGSPARVLRTLDESQHLERENLDGPVAGFGAGDSETGTGA